MANLTPIEIRYKAAIKKLFPKGKLWQFNPGSFLDQFVESLCKEPARIEARGVDFLREMNPLQTFEMIDNWERLLGLPDECTPSDLTLTVYDRRVRILQKLATGGGQSRAFFKLIAKQLGYDADIFDVINFKNFRVGRSRVGETLANSTAWAYTFQVKAPASTVKRFRVGRSSVGERLIVVENRILECVIRKYAPAHMQVIFSYTL